MKFTKRIFLILIACAITTNICAIQFRHLSIKDGLSQLSVLSIYQDKLGRMWFGTEEGINVFDGNNLTAIKTLRNIPPRNLEVRWICGDEKGNIYFQLGTSIVCIDFATQSNTVLVKKRCYHTMPPFGQDLLRKSWQRIHIQYCQAIYTLHGATYKRQYQSAAYRQSWHIMVWHT